MLVRPGHRLYRLPLQHTAYPRPPSNSFRGRLHSSALPKYTSRRVTNALVIGVPFLAGVALLLQPQEQSPVPTILSARTVIPCASHKSFLVSSPNEQRTSLVQRLIRIIVDFVWEPIRTGARFVHLVFIFGPVLILAPMMLVGRKPSRRTGERWGALWWYRLLVAQMQRAGPTFIKLAQWAGSRHDLFPIALCDRLGQLHSNGRPHAFWHTKRAIEKAFKCPFEDVFSAFDHTPIGVGAIAQVYRATLNPHLIPTHYLSPKHETTKRGVPRSIKDTSAAIAHYTRAADAHPPTVPTSAVAIKVLHPGAASMIRRDLAIMSFFARCLHLIPGVEWLSLREEIDVFGRMMNEQLDLRHEASNLRTFEKNFAGRRSALTFPRPLEDFSTTEVLVEEYQNAVPLKTFLRNGGGPYDHRLANLGLDAFLNMLLLDNFVHSDLHPGNIMVKFYRPTTKYIYQNIFASIFHTTPPSSDISPSDTVGGPEGEITSNVDGSTGSYGPTPSQESDAVVERLKPLSQNQSAFLAELDKIVAEGYLPSLVFIDAGLVTTLSPTNRQNFLELFRAIAGFDGYRAGQLMVERCRTPERVIDPDTFALKMQHLVLGVKARTFTLAQITISDVLTQVLGAVRTHHVKMEGDFVNTVLAILLLEGIGRRLDPDLDLFKGALPILRQLGTQMSAREALEEMPKGNIGAMFKIWVWIEARSLISDAVVNIDNMVKYDLLSPNV